MRKQLGIHIILLAACLVIAGCGESGAGSQMAAKPVQTVNLQTSAANSEIVYLGVLKSHEVQKCAFKSSGKILAVHVSQGQEIQAGDPLVDLDTTEISLAADAARAQADGAIAQYEKAVNGATVEELNLASLAVDKAESAYEFTKSNFTRIDALHTAGAVSDNDFEAAGLELSIREAELAQARENLAQLQNGARSEDKAALYAQYEAAEANWAARNSLLTDAHMCAGIDGYILDVLVEEGEFTAAGYPVMVVGSKEQSISVGLSQKDARTIKQGARARIKLADFETMATVETLAQLPDESSGTYTAELKLDTPVPASLFFIGSDVDVYFQAGPSNGIWVPISSILNDGQDYVFVVQNNRALRKNIIPGEVVGDQVKVEGLANGEQLVIKGMNNLENGSPVKLLPPDENQ